MSGISNESHRPLASIMPPVSGCNHELELEPVSSDEYEHEYFEPDNEEERDGEGTQSSSSAPSSPERQEDAAAEDRGRKPEPSPGPDIKRKYPETVVWIVNPNVSRPWIRQPTRNLDPDGSILETTIAYCTAIRRKYNEIASKHKSKSRRGKGFNTSSKDILELLEAEHCADVENFMKHEPALDVNNNNAADADRTSNCSKSSHSSSNRKSESSRKEKSSKRRPSTSTAVASEAEKIRHHSHHHGRRHHHHHHHGGHGHGHQHPPPNFGPPMPFSTASLSLQPQPMLLLQSTPPPTSQPPPLMPPLQHQHQHQHQWSYLPNYCPFQQQKMHPMPPGLGSFGGGLVMPRPQQTLYSGVLHQNTGLIGGGPPPTRTHYWQDVPDHNMRLQNHQQFCRNPRICFFQRPVPSQLSQHPQ